jgi:competence protein ComFC
MSVSPLHQYKRPVTMNRIKRIIEQSLDIIFPGRCRICGSMLLFFAQPGIPLCESCSLQIKPLEGRRCEICSSPLLSEQRICTRCREQEFHFHSNISLFEYSGVVKELLYYYKFKGMRRFAELFSHMAGRIIKAHYPGLPIIPVPGTKGTMKRRGWNHLIPILKLISREYGILFVDSLEKRTDIPQKALSFAQRKENLKGNIMMKPGKVCHFSHVVLFDDIFTTGATADECSRVLLNDGVEKVYVVTLAID